MQMQSDVCFVSSSGTQTLLGCFECLVNDQNHLLSNIILEQPQGVFLLRS